MKRILVLALALPAVFLAASLYAQSPINVGVKLGGNFTGVEFDVNNPDAALGDDSRQFGFVGGAFVRLNLGKISIQPELLYSQKKFETEENVNSGAPAFEFTSSELDIPVLVGIDLIDAKVVRLRLVAGPMVSFSVSNSVDIATSGVQLNTDDIFSWEEAKFGYAAGVSLDVTKLTFDLRYNGQFGDQFDPSTFQNALGSSLETSANWIQLTVGFKFI